MSTRFSPDGSEAHLLAILREMACMDPADGASFASLLERDIREGMRDTEVLIVAFDTLGDVPERIASLEQLGNAVQTVILREEVESDG